MDRKNYKALVLFSFLLIAFSACKKDENKPSGNPATPTVQPGEDVVYVACEGSLGNGNSSLTMYKPVTNTAELDVYFGANNQYLGDVFQSMQQIGDELFLCVNNSDKIIVVDAENFKRKGEISVPKPRYILPINDTKAYVSTLFSNKIYIINPKTFSVTGTITLPAQNPEDMLLYQNRVYVCAWDTANTNIFVLDVNSNQIVSTFDIAAAAPQEVVMDKDNMLWVLSGNIEKGKSAKLTQLHPNSGFILNAYTFPSKADPVRLETNNARDVLYYIGVDYYGSNSYNGVFRMNISDAALPATPFIPAQQYQYYWALGIHPETDDIYIGDPKGFIQKGTVSVYKADGSQKTQFNTGVGPGHFFFN